jgi:hypothetical protein
MSPEEFRKFYPPLIEWIRKMLDANAHVAQTASSRRFSRLPHYFAKHTLVSTKGVIVDPAPMALLTSTPFFLWHCPCCRAMFESIPRFPANAKLVKEATMSVDVYPPLNEMRDI